MSFLTAIYDLGQTQIEKFMISHM